MISSPRRALLATLVVTVALPGSAAAQTAGKDQGYFGISPARRNVVARPPATLRATRVSNTTRQTFRVRVESVLLDQDLTGSYTLSETPRDLGSAAKILSASPASFTLAPGASRQVAVRWTQLPLDSRAAYVGVLFTGQAQAPRSNRPVSTIQRLLNVNFLRLPGTYHPNGTFARLGAEQGAPRILRLTPRVRNTGDVIAAPRLPILRIVDAAGKVVVKQPFRGPVILPGRQVDVPVDVRKILPKGTYTAIATMRFGRNRHARIAQRFTLVGPNLLPTARIVLRNLQGEGEIGGDSHVTARLHSAGSLAASTNVRLDLYRVDRQGTQSARPIATRRLRFSAIAPSKEAALKATYRKLAKGSYRAIATYRATAAATATATADFTLSKKQSLFQRLRTWLDRHTGLLIALLLLIVLAGVVWFLLRRQRHLQRELAESRAGGGAAGPAAPAVTDLNAAGVDELATVPGIGLRAAARIVEHREEYGRFAAVDDLQRVEGFDAERVASLRARVRV